MVNDAETKTKRKQSVLLGSAHKNKSPFRDPEDRSAWLVGAALAEFLLVPAVMVCLPQRLLNGSWAAIIMIGWFGFFIGIMACAFYRYRKDRVAFVAANLHAPEERDLLTYISAFAVCGDNVKAQTAPILCELLERLSVDELACIPDTDWSYLCPRPEDTPSGYLDDKKVDLYDPLLMAAFSAIRRSKRVESLPTIKGWRKLRKTGYHSRAFVLTLQECYETLLSHQATLPHSSTLLRPSSAEATSLNTLLRPLTGTHSAETGAQLLRASTRQDPGNSDRNETSGSAATANEVLH